MLKITLLPLLALGVFGYSAFAQPIETGDFKESDLVELIKRNPRFVLDICYATTNTFVGKAVYLEARVFLQCQTNTMK